MKEIDSEATSSKVRARGECRRAAIKRRGGKHVEVVSLLISILEAITRQNMVCGGEKVVRGGKHTNNETGRRTIVRWLSLPSIG